MANEPMPIADPLKATIARIEAKRQRLGGEDHAKAVAAEVRQEIAPGGQLPPEQGWLCFAPMPSDLCRVSPFFPIGKNEMEKREFIEDMSIASNAWGEVTYTGPKLSTYDEDVLLAVLALIKGEMSQEGGWTYSGPLLPILRVMGVKNVGGGNYKRVKAALKRLSVAGVCIQTKRGKWSMSSMLAWAGGDDKAGTVAVTINVYFAQMYAAGTVNLMDLAKRAELSRPVSKALHRFATSHRKEWRGYYLTLASALNLDLSQPQKQIRRQIKQALLELQKVGVLGDSSGFSGDVVTLALETPGGKKIKA